MKNEKFCSQLCTYFERHTGFRSKRDYSNRKLEKLRPRKKHIMAAASLPNKWLYKYNNLKHETTGLVKNETRRTKIKNTQKSVEAYTDGIQTRYVLIKDENNNWW
jgi:uncharacterized coiled-coil DUF342 family protein